MKPPPPPDEPPGLQVATFEPQCDVAERMFRQKADWFELLKALRQAQDISLFEAEGLALRHEGWRRWAQSRVDSDPKCRKYAAFHAKRHGSNGHVLAERARADGQPVLRLRTTTPS